MLPRNGSGGPPQPGRSPSITTRRLLATVLFVGGLCCSACGPHINAPTPPNPKATTPVSGIVKIDGQPGHGVKVMLNPVSGVDAANPTVTEGEADKDGKFVISTYGGGDGAPPGDYMLTFEWYDRTVIRIGGGDPKDQFKGKYAKKTDHKLTVPSGPEPFDAGTIELSSK
jgi:hypothetical protein